MRELRRARRWTQAELASRLGLSQSRISELEGGAGSFSAEHLLVLSRLFNVPPSAFAPPIFPDAHAELQNALVRHGAGGLRQREDVIPRADLGVAEVIRDALVSGIPRFVAALAPVLVSNIDRIGLASLHAALAHLGFEGRLSWLVENTAAAVRTELAAGPRPQRARYLRRALVLLETALEAASARRRGEPAIDILDHDIRSMRSRREVEASASTASRRWGIVSALQPEDFARALRGASLVED